jgi:hypothetical protein
MSEVTPAITDGVGIQMFISKEKFPFIFIIKNMKRRKYV